MVDKGLGIRDICRWPWKQSQAHTAGLIEGIRESLFDRARRISTGDRVAEASESYEPQE